jgi:hypothetical protein
MDRRLEAEETVRRTLLALAALALAGVLLALWSGPAEAATTFTVNKTGDAKDRRISDTRCDSSPDRGNQCTLRAAIQESNDTTGADTINFNIVSDASVKTIKPAKPLPEITAAVTINGYSQGSATTTTSDDAKENTLAEGNDAVLKVQLNGTNAGSANGLVIEASDSTVKGLVINRFAGNGVLLSGSGATGNKVEGNFIGTNTAGSADLGNGDDGVDVFGADDNTIGGTAAGARNLISGNGGDGVQIVGGLGTTGNEIQGNFIGTDRNGTNALGNTEEGVLLFSVSDNTVGGTTAGARNVISGNNQDGVQISGNASIGVATGNEVLGNLVGTKANGTGALANVEDGVDIFDARVNTVGGTASEARNIISGNQDDGVEISGNLATDNQVLGNFVGTDENGTADLGNSNDGVEISSGADDNTIGGTAAGARNILSGNGGDGVQIIGGLLATGNEVLGNFIGTKANGNEALGNTGDGVDISQAEGNTVGGTVAAARNVISANAGDGVVIFGDEATGNKVQGNFIGTGANGTTALGNDDGVAISSGNDSTIGSAIGSAIGSTAGGNTIAHNDQDGVLVFGGLAVGNRILSNSIFSNGETSIDLGGGTEDSFGVTANDEDDPDATAPASNNHRQNFPVITSAIKFSTGFTTISGTLNSNPGETFTVQCFVAAPDSSGHGEGQILVAQDTTVTTDSGGDDSFSCVTSFPVVVGQAVTATATNTSGTASGTSIGDSSEFSLNVGVVPGP